MLHEMWMYRMNLPFPISLVLLSLQITHPTTATNIHLSIADVKCQLMFSPHCFMSFLKKKCFAEVEVGNGRNHIFILHSSTILSNFYVLSNLIFLLKDC